MVGIFSLCVTVAVACASMVDSARSAKSERLLFQEGSGNLKEITKSRGGGLQALAQFTHRIVNFGISNTTATPVHAKKASVHAAAMKRHAALGLKLAAPASKAEKVHVSSKRLAKLSLSKLEDGEEAAPAADAAEGDAAAADDAAANATAPAEAADGGLTPAASAEAADGAADMRYSETNQPGWDNSAWTTSDWTVWTLTGPVLTMTAAMFIFYTYGWQWALPTLLIMVAVDMFALYFNV